MSLYYINNQIPILNLDYIDLKYCEKEILISTTLNTYIQQMKKEIDNCKDEWDYVKKYANPYEFVHTKIPGHRQAICKYQPISRSFFKLYEILDVLSFSDLYKNKKLNSLHLAEAPGGFIEALHYFSSKKNININESVGLSLHATGNSVPSWNKNYIKSYNNVHIEKGINNCDLTSSENFLYLIKKYKHKFELITADGGFDFSGDFNNQETLSQPLILAEVLFALYFQKKNGCFVLKIFDCFTRLSVELIYILCSMYDKVYVYKPHTSRLANSEKYIVCKFYKNTERNRELLKSLIPKILDNCSNISSILNFDIPLLFLNKLEEINAILGQQQLETISNTLSIINNDFQKEKLSSLKDTNISKCLQWCKKHDFASNPIK